MITRFGDLYDVECAFFHCLHDTKDATIDNRTTLMEDGVQRCGVEHNTRQITLLLPAAAGSATA